jgi:hypothetical protein
MAHECPDPSNRIFSRLIRTTGRTRQALPLPKENLMLYKTIVLRCLEDRPSLARRLQERREMLAMMEAWSEQLMLNHLAWMGRLATTNPDLSPHQIKSQAMEIALEEFQDHFPDESSMNEPAALG